MSRLSLTAIVCAATLLAGCDMIAGQLGIESPEKVAAAREADGKAIGGACRHAGRAIEDCYAMNKKADKASVFAGWRDMNDYMRENKIDVVPPQATTQVANAGAKSGEADDAKPASGTESSSAPWKAHTGRPRRRSARSLSPMPQTGAMPASRSG